MRGVGVFHKQLGNTRAIDAVLHVRARGSARMLMQCFRTYLFSLLVLVAFPALLLSASDAEFLFRMHGNFGFLSRAAAAMGGLVMWDAGERWPAGRVIGFYCSLARVSSYPPKCAAYSMNSQSAVVNCRRSNIICKNFLIHYLFHGKRWVYQKNSRRTTAGTSRSYIRLPAAAPAYIHVYEKTGSHQLVAYIQGNINTFTLRSDMWEVVDLSGRQIALLSVFVACLIKKAAAACITITVHSASWK